MEQNLPIGRIPLNHAGTYIEILRGRIASRRCHTNKAALANKTNLALYLDIAKGRNKRERITLIAHQLKREFANALNQVTFEGEFAQINYSHFVLRFRVLNLLLDAKTRALVVFVCRKVSLRVCGRFLRSITLRSCGLVVR